MKKKIKKEQERRMTNQFSFRRFVIIVCVCTFIISSGIFLYVRQLNKALQSETIAYLEEVSQQGAMRIESQISDDLEILQAISTAISAYPDPSEENIKQLLRAERTSNRFKYMAFVRPDGLAILHDDSFWKFSQEDFFQKALAGEPNVSERRIDAADGQGILTEAAPVYFDGQIIGVLLSARSTSEYAKALDSRFFDGKGFALMVDEKGNKVVESFHENALPGVFNIFDASDDPDHSLRAQVEQAFLQRRSGTIIHDSLKRGDLFVSYRPLSINDWILITVVPANRITHQTRNFVTMLSVLCVAIVLCLFIAGFFVWRLQRNYRNEIYKLLHTDPITHQPNARAVYAHVQKMMDKNRHLSYVVVALNIVNFKLFNEKYGFSLGDQLLVYISRTLQEEVRKTESCNRVYGGEFALVLTYSQLGELKNRLEKLNTKLQAFSTAEQRHFSLIFSFGIYIVTDRSMEVQRMYHRALLARNHIRNRYDQILAFYEDDDNPEASLQRQIEQAQEEAILHEDFIFSTCPIVDTQTNVVLAYELHLKWPLNGDKPLLNEEDFVPVFRDNGFILQYDRFVLKYAFKHINEWINFNEILSISINTKHLEDTFFARWLKTQAMQAGVTPDRISLQLSPLKEIMSSRAQQTLKLLKDAGFRVTARYMAGDLLTLTRLPMALIDTIYVGRELWLPKTPVQKALSESFVRVCQQMNLLLIAQGVNDSHTIAPLAAAGYSAVTLVSKQKEAQK